MLDWPNFRAAEKQLHAAIRADWLNREAAQFKTATEMSQALGIDRPSLLRIAKSVGVTLPEGRMGGPKIDPIELKQLMDEGKPRAAIANHFGVTPRAVSTAAKRLGRTFKTKKPKAPPKPTVSALSPELQSKYWTLRNEFKKSHVEALTVLLNEVTK